ncbi:YjbF family lipoprotein [uncultured Gemmobacter sp.]|jgi:predicted small secreted protein|uniref:YjbF family lipoprotein n=1 Tax=uncultured Gemmobacter sp. TaxID=1095917 RepID=UPI000B0EA1FB|nr:YjbF family lipoprotein [uncultured Gemmobacter sp.]
MKLLKSAFALLTACAVLAGCSSDSESGSPLVSTAKNLSSAMLKKRSAGAAAPVTRADLAKLNVPVIKGELKSGNSTIYLVPIARNGAVDTWSTSDDLTISFRDGVMLTTRGFGPDIMQAVVPSRAQLASGGGSHRRSYFYLDGADKMHRFDYDCSVSVIGGETITVVGRQHSTRHVAETCRGGGREFTNEYWFEGGNFIRKSKELLVPEWGYLELARVIDNG